MTIRCPDSPAQQSIAAFSDPSEETSGPLQNEFADCAASLWDTVGRLSQPQPARRPLQRGRVGVYGPVQRIIRDVTARVNALLVLPHNWDSYGGRPVSLIAAKDAISWLNEVAPPGLSIPSIVPGSDSSIQLEWHTRGIDFEVNFSPSSAPEFIYEDHHTGTVDDGLLSPQNQHGRIFVQQLAAYADR